MSKLILTHHQVAERAEELWNTASRVVGRLCYPVPRGGVPVAYLLTRFGAIVVDNPEDADFIVDDIIDSGTTKRHYESVFPGKPFYALVTKEASDDWVVFPWEHQDDSGTEDDTIVGTLRNRLVNANIPFLANDNIAPVFADGELVALQEEVGKRCQHLLNGLLIDTKNDHNTNGTALRMAKMFIREVHSGRYIEKPVITKFPNAKQLDEMYVTGPISVRSMCSHHFAPIIGKCWVAVIPGENVMGLSKFNRLVEWIASRPQIQEELIVQIADEIEKELGDCKGLAVIVDATHMCMTWRGVKEDSCATMATSVMRGSFKENAATRSELFSLINIK